MSYLSDRAEEEAAVRAQERECLRTPHPLDNPIDDPRIPDYVPYRPDPVGEELAGLRAVELADEREVEEELWREEER